MNHAAATADGVGVDGRRGIKVGQRPVRVELLPLRVGVGGVELELLPLASRSGRCLLELLDELLHLGPIHPDGFFHVRSHLALIEQILDLAENQRWRDVLGRDGLARGLFSVGDRLGGS